MPSRAAAMIVVFLMAAIVTVAVLFRPAREPGPAEPVELIVDYPRGYVCGKAAGPIIVDGKLDEPSWQAARWSDKFVDIEGDLRPEPKHPTRMKMLWDDRALYIAAQLDEPDVWATATVHDSYIFHFDNDFEVFLDPDGDNHLYAELEMNALNTTWDLLLVKPYKDGGPAIDAWEIAGLKTAVHVDGTLNDPQDRDRGWSIEIAWPWDGLKQLARTPVPPRDGDRWRINFSRVELEHEIVAGKYRKKPNTKEENWVWSAQGVIDMHRPERWAYVQFSSAAPGAVAFRPDPAAPARELLHRIYYAQGEYRQRNGRYATSLRELRIPRFTHPDLDEPILDGTPQWYEATVSTGSGPQAQRWRIRADRKITPEP